MTNNECRKGCLLPDYHAGPCTTEGDIAAQVTSYALTRADSPERWWYDVATRTVRDENGLAVVAIRESAPNVEGEIIAAAPHALSLVLRLSRLLSAVTAGEAGPAWKALARELGAEADQLIADPGQVEG
jgi:hypothetical protein